MQTRKRLPPGPKGVPFFGNALQVKFANLSQYLCQFGKDYKYAHSISFLNQDIVVLNSYELIEELMTSSKYATVLSGRPKTFLGDVFHRSTVLFTTFSEKWAALRKLSFRGLRSYGTHLADVEILVQSELEQLMSRLTMKSDTAIDPSQDIDIYVTSIILMLTFATLHEDFGKCPRARLCKAFIELLIQLTGRQRNNADPLFRLTNGFIEELDKLAAPACNTVLTSFPWLANIPIGYGATYKRLVYQFKLLKDTVYKELEDKDRRVCFMDYLFSEKEKGTLDDESLSGVFHSILSAGSATSRSTLRSLMLVLASRPDVQEKIQQEIEQVIGKDRLPSINDKNQMPYAQAVLWELFRLFPVAPLGLPHCPLEDVEIREYYIPKDTVIFLNIWHVLHDGTFWECSWEFKPSRFLEENGQLVTQENEKRKRMIAFGLGKRQCIGEVLARVRIFLAMTVILQNFTLHPDPAQPLPDTDPREWNTVTLLHAPDYKIVIKKR